MEPNDEYEGDRLFLAVEQSHKHLVESFESFQRISGSYSAVQSLIESASVAGNESFEVAARPVMTAIYAGTSIDAEDIDVSMESVLGVLKKLADAVIKAITNFFKRLMDMLSNIDLAATWLLRRVNVIERKRVGARGRMPKENTITLGRIHGHLRVGRIFADDALKLSRELDHLDSVIKVVATDYVEAIASGAGKIPSLSANKTGSELSSALVQAILQIPFEAVASKLKMSSIPRERFGRSDVMATSPLIGGDSIFFMKGNLVEKGLRGIRFYGYFYEPTTRELITVEDSREFKALTPADLAGLPEQMTAIIRSLSRGVGDQAKGRLNRIRYDLENYVRQQSVKETITASDMDQIRKVVGAVSHWTQCVSAPLFSKSMSVIRATIVYCEQSIKTYQ